MTSFGGTRFDFQVSGEFVLAKNAHLQLQARIEPSGGAANPQGTVSYIAAIAMTLGGDRVTIDYSRAQPLWLNGVAVTLLPGQFLTLAAGTIKATGNGFVITYNTGEKITSSNDAVLITVPKSDAAGMMGVLGPDNGNPADVFELPNGTVLPQPLTFNQLYQTFANAWRVTDATSLFDYTNGQTTASFTNLNFPPAPVTLSDLPASLIAQAQAALAGTSFANTAEQQNAELDYILGGGDLAAAASDGNAGLAGNTTANTTGGPPPELFGITPGQTVTNVGTVSANATFDVFRTGPSVDTVVLDWAVVDPDTTGTVGAGEYIGALPSGQVTLVAGETLATFSVPTPAGLILPDESLQVEITNTSTPAVSFANQIATDTLASSVPVAGIAAVPELYEVSGIGTLSGSGTFYTLNFGTVGADGVPAIELGVFNATSVFGDLLDGSFSVTGGLPDFTNIGSFSSVGPNAADTFNFTPGTIVGVETGTLVLDPSSSNTTGYDGILPGITLVATGTVVPATAQPAVITSPIALVGREGGVLLPGVTIANTAVIGSDDLAVQLSDVGGNVLPPQTAAIAPDSSTVVTLSDIGTKAGGFTDTLDVAYSSDKPGAQTGSALAGTTVVLDGTSYVPAVPVLQTQTIDFGTLHQGDPTEMVGITLDNALTPGVYADDLLASWNGATSVFTGSGNINLAPGGSGTLTAALPTTVGGIFSGDASIALSSHDAAQADATLGTENVVLRGTVIADAQPVFIGNGGIGTISQTGADSFTLNLGTFAENSAPVFSQFVIGNNVAAPADSVTGTLTLLAGTVRTSVGTVASLAPESFSNVYTVALVPGGPGTASETVTFNPVDSVVGTIAPDTLTITAEIACYHRGTRVLTARGEVAVEDLVIGDALITRRGEARALRWIGHRAYAGRFLAANPDVLPICIRAGAIGPGLPKRDLYVSPQHALYFDNVLIPASALVNDATILRVAASDVVEYFHVELSTHDVIFAEGIEAETYVDDGNRRMFDNAAGMKLCTEPACYYAPRLDMGVEVDAVRASLAARAVAAGFVLKRTHTVWLEACGLQYFVVPPDVSALRLRSSSGRVAGDRRVLGALIVALRIDGANIDFGAPIFGRGFHQLETHGRRKARWTNGEATLAVEGGEIIEIDVAALAPQEEVRQTG
jgi:hypothetical protein